MLKRRRRLLTLVSLALWCWSAAAAQETSLEQQYRELSAERDRLDRAVHVLQEEIRLSQQKRPYLVADLRSKELILKVHGLAVKRISAAEVRRLGSLDCTTGATTLQEFDAVRVPKIQPAGTPDGETEVEVTDMPRSYRLGFLSDGHPVSLYIDPAPATVVSRAWAGVSAAFSSSSRAILQALGSKRSVYLWRISSEDAQALFWALEKGTPAILVCD